MSDENVPKLQAAVVSDAGNDSQIVQRNVLQEAATAVHKLFFSDPLYRILEGDEAFMDAVEEVLTGKRGLDFDLYCMSCEKVTPWTIKPFVHRNSGGGAGLSSRYSQAYVPTVHVVNAVCLRRQHFYTYVLHYGERSIQKIGQKPSMADIAHGELKAIPGIDAADRKELGRALGLFAHDTPLGAFVYLRRVFERMIERAHDRHIQKLGSAIENWKDLRMGERIAALGDELPPVVSTNSVVWSLLSRGIHQLSDEDAAKLFPVVKAVIFEMLGDEERHRQADRQREETRLALQSAADHFKSQDN